MYEERLEFENDKLYHYFPLPQYGEGVARKDLVMTKEVFVECYRRWIEGQGENADGSNK